MREVPAKSVKELLGSSEKFWEVQTFQKLGGAWVPPSDMPKVLQIRHLDESGDNAEFACQPPQKMFAHQTPENNENNENGRCRSAKGMGYQSKGVASLTKRRFWWWNGENENSAIMAHSHPHKLDKGSAAHTPKTTKWREWPGATFAPKNNMVISRACQTPDQRKGEVSDGPYPSNPLLLKNPRGQDLVAQCSAIGVSVAATPRAARSVFARNFSCDTVTEG